MENYFDTLPDLPIEEICQNMLKEKKYGDLSAFVQTSKRIHSLCQKYLDVSFEKHTNEIMDIINTLGQIYHGWRGLQKSPGDVINSSKRIFKGDDTNWIKKLIINNYADIYTYTDDFRLIYEDLKIEDIDKFFVDCQSIVLGISYGEKYLFNLSELELNFNEIIIRKKCDWDQSRLIEWYNQIPTKERRCYYNEDLDPMKTRKFIKIHKLFTEVHLYRELKYYKLTIDDILFASRALMTNQNSIISGYTMISNDNGCLVLEINFKY